LAIRERSKPIAKWRKTFTSLPSAARVRAARLLAEIGDP
jgi:hypothetical protein